jgi:hypothetical protein
MRNPLIAEIRRIRAKMDRAWARNPNPDYVAESQELRRKVCDVFIDDEGNPHYITNEKKMYEVLIAPRLARAATRPTKPTRRRSSRGGDSQSKNAAHQARQR